MDYNKETNEINRIRVLDTGMLSDISVLINIAVKTRVGNKK